MFGKDKNPFLKEDGLINNVHQQSQYPYSEESIRFADISVSLETKFSISAKISDLHMFFFIFMFTFALPHKTLYI